MALNLARLREKQAETSKGSGKFFRCTDGKNLIRIFKFTHEVTKDDVAKGYFKKEELGKDVEELDRPVTLHYNYSAESKKPTVSNSRIMEEYRNLSKSEDREDQKRAEAIKPSRKYFLNVVDINDIEGGVKVFGAPKGVYNSILEYLVDPEYGGEDALFGYKGLDFGISYDSKASGSEMYKVIPRAGGKSEKLSKDLEEQVVDLYDPANLSMFGQVLDSEPVFADSDEEDEDEKPATNGKKKVSEDDVDDWLSTPPKKKKGK